MTQSYGRWKTMGLVPPVLALLFVNLCFATYGVLTKAALKSGMNAGLFVLARDGLTAVVLVCAQCLRHRSWEWPLREHLWRFVLLGGCGLIFGQYFQLLGIDEAGPVLQAIWSNTTPVATFLLALVMGTERCVRRGSTAAKACGVLVTTVGALVAAGLVGSSGGADGGGDAASERGVLLGTVFFALQVLIGGAVFWNLQKQMLDLGYPASLVTAWYYLFGVAAMATVIVPVVLVEAQPLNVQWIDAAALGFCVPVFPLCAFLLAWANERVSPVFVMAFSPVQIIATSLLEYAVYSQVPTLGQAVGAAMVLAGISALTLGVRMEQNIAGLIKLHDGLDEAAPPLLDTLAGT